MVDPPLRWISPNAIRMPAAGIVGGGGAAPGRFVLRSGIFRRRARLEVRQDGRLLRRRGPAWCPPGRSG